MAKYLITGVSGTGKTHLTAYGVARGMPATDADTVEGLSGWFKDSRAVTTPQVITKEFLDTHDFLWDKNFLRLYLDAHTNIFFFGFAGNVFDCIDLFDRSFYLHLAQDLFKARLEHPSRANQMGKTAEQQNEIISYATTLTQEAQAHDLAFIRADQEPAMIYDEIRRFS